MLRPGDKLSHYRVLEPLGQGGMGVVYKAEDEALKRVVALKVIRADLVSNERYARMLQREARAAAALHDPHVASILTVERDRDLTFLVLEYLPGGSLADRVKRRGPLPWREAAQVGAEIARGLAAIHGAGLVHRDLKPGNVLLDADGKAKIADFGLAKHAAAPPGTVTAAGEIMGSLHYMAPEQQGEGSITDAADLYALGATLQHLVAGAPPFKGTTGVELLKRHLVDPPPPLRALAPATPAALERLVLRLLAKDPARRGGPAMKVARELEAIAASDGAEEPRSWVPWVGAALILLGGAAGAAGLALRPPAPAPRVTPPVAPVASRAAPPAPPPPAPPVARAARLPRGTIVATTPLPETDPIARISVDKTTGHVLLGGAVDRRTTLLVEPATGSVRRFMDAALSGAFFHPTRSVIFGSTGRSEPETRALSYEPGRPPTPLWAWTEPDRFGGGSLDVDPETDLLYEVAQYGNGSDTVYVIDAKSGRLVASDRRLGVGWNVVVDRVAHRAYVSRAALEWSDTENRQVTVLGPPPNVAHERVLPGLVVLAADPRRGRVYLRHRYKLVAIARGETTPGPVTSLDARSAAVDPEDGWVYVPLKDKLVAYGGETLDIRDTLPLPGVTFASNLCIDADRRLVHIYVPPAKPSKHFVLTVAL